MKFSIGTLILQIELVVTVKRDFECRNVSKLINLFGIFGLLKIPCKDQKKISFEPSSTKVEFLSEIFMGQIKP